MLNYEEFLKDPQIDDEYMHYSSAQVLRDGYSAFICDEMAKLTSSGPCRTLKDMTEEEIKKIEQLYKAKVIIND